MAVNIDWELVIRIIASLVGCCLVHAYCRQGGFWAVKWQERCKLCV